METLNQIGATLLAIGALWQAVLVADGITWNPTTRRVAFSTGWLRDAEMWGWVIVMFGAASVAIAAWG